MTDGPTAGRILVVDDQESLTAALCDTLHQRGYEASGFSRGDEALAAIRDGGFDLILADLRMPDMDGIHLMRAAFEIDPTLVGIIMTGRATIDTAIEAMKSGALDFILKPFRISAILPVLTRALGVRRLRLENAALERSLRQRTVELEELNDELEAFSFSVSHDLRAPLRAVDGFASALAREFAEALPPEAKRLLDRVVTNAHRMEALIDGLLRLSGVSREPLARREVDLAALARAIAEDLGREHAGRRFEVRIAELPPCTGDPALLRQLLANLLANAFKFTRDRDPAVIEVGFAREPEAGTVYHVRDNGAGYDPRHGERLFGAFQRLHRAEDFTGTGIGLSIARRIVARHGGRIWAEGEVDRGATFFFTLGAPPAEPL